MIPVVLVTGFLGAGKTTLLNHLLTAARGTRIGVIVNDFGSIDVDAMTVAGRVDSMISLGNGCLCCAADTSDVDGMLARLAEPALRMDVIVIEASGLADPQAMVRLLLASEVPNVRYGGLVTVVDAAGFAATAADHPDLARQLKLADLVVLNKTDRVDSTAELIRTIRTFNGEAPVVSTTHGALDPSLLFEVGPNLPVARQLSFDDLADHTDHAHARYETVSFTSDDPMHPVRLMEFLDNRPAGLYRMKGFVHFGVPGHEDRFGLQTVGNYLRFHRSPWPRGTRPATQLVLIGKDVDTDQVLSRLAACARTDEVEQRDMLWVTRYVAEE
ncbi:CobW family GTP-binding protein [Actinocrispum wychmicini]|uniref:G3E family GTPase n=1 Tax=Actinocrispum wychmicini TaxID=1213861 RepID=A0A4R2JKD3_9PSEU|nr:GTP-binding protein [Actinocrispum wychmicini]TCO60473.1 G3E family GTPase [Actinocrispum wychmicini]